MSERTVIVRDEGFAEDDLAGVEAVELSPSDDLTELQGRLGGIALVRVAFPSFADGRGFTLARRLRAMGYSGRLRAAGHVLADQYAMARRVGFDEVEIGADLAARQDEAQWRARSDWRAGDYRDRVAAARLTGAPAPGGTIAG
jgi:uncharacterized protein (DUF934 family)